MAVSLPRNICTVAGFVLHVYRGYMRGSVLAPFRIHWSLLIFGVVPFGVPRFRGTDVPIGLNADDCGVIIVWGHHCGERTMKSTRLPYHLIAFALLFFAAGGQA